MITEADCKKSALNVITNCCCGPLTRVGGSFFRNNRKKVSYRSDDLLKKMWTCVRQNNGIMILLNRMLMKAPILEADALRALACKALVGLSRSDEIGQVIQKLPLFTNGMLQTLMKEPILQDKR